MTEPETPLHMRLTNGLGKAIFDLTTFSMVIHGATQQIAKAAPVFAQFSKIIGEPEERPEDAD